MVGPATVTSFAGSGRCTSKEEKSEDEGELADNHCPSFRFGTTQRENSTKNLRLQLDGKSTPTPMVTAHTMHMKKCFPNWRFHAYQLCRGH